MLQIKNGKAPGTNKLPGELLKYSQDITAPIICNIVNSIFTTHQPIPEINTGRMVILNKPLKTAICPNTRPLTVLNDIRKVYSNIVRNRIEDKLFNYISPTQAAYRPKRSTSDIIWALRFHHARALRHQEELFIIGMDFSKAFDTIDRSKLVNTILPPLLDEDELRLIRYHLSTTTLLIKVANSIEQYLNSITGTPQGDGLSPLLFIVYLEYVMRQVREALIPILQPPAALPPQNEDQPDPPQDLLPIFELTYADDMNIATDDRDVAVTIIEVADPIFEENDLFLNQDKLDIIDLNSKAHVINAQEPLFKGTKNFKMLGTYIDPERDISNRIYKQAAPSEKCPNYGSATTWSLSKQDSRYTMHASPQSFATTFIPLASRNPFLTASTPFIDDNSAGSSNVQRTYA